MNVETASTFLSGSILFCLGCIDLSIGAVIINNLFHAFWKKFEIFATKPGDPIYFVTKEEMQQIETARANNETKIS
jgi:hypothetical protein